VTISPDNPASRQNACKWTKYVGMCTSWRIYHQFHGEIKHSPCLFGTVKVNFYHGKINNLPWSMQKYHFTMVKHQFHHGKQQFTMVKWDIFS
jgi:hypothetical protein